MANGKKDQVGVTIDTTPAILKGNYTNALKVVATKRELIIDFAFVYPQADGSKRGIMTDRVILSDTLAENLSLSITKILDERKKKQNNGK